MQPRQIKEVIYFHPNRKPRCVIIGVFMWLFVAAVKTVVQPLADVVGHYTCYDSF